MINPKEQELLNLKDELQELLEDGEDNQLLRDKIQELENELQQKENIIKEAKKYIKEHSTTINFKTMRADHNLNMNELLEILDKVD